VSISKVAISEVAEVNPRLSAENRPELDTLISFVPMATVSETTLKIEDPINRPYKEVSKGFTPFKRGDIIIAKITPCFENGKMAYANNLPNDFGFGSTEFHVIRPKANIVGGYLFHLLREPFVRKAGKLKMKGAVGQRRVPADFFACFQIPLPPLEEQKRIAGILDAADALRAKRRESLAKLDDLLQSTFLDMFGYPVTNPKGWDRVKLHDVLEKIDGGWSPKCLSRKASSSEWGVLKLGAISWCQYDDNEQKALPSDLDPKPKIEVKKGDLLFARKNTHDLVAAVAYVSETRPKLMLPDLIFRFVLKSESEMTPIFLWKLLVDPNQRKKIQRLAGGSAGSMPNISKTKLLSISLIHPPLDLQRRFAEIVSSVEEQKAKMKKHLDQLDDLFASLQQRAFRGDL
jgi:type I restriction enzyme, S subunit